jgi:hypothetical protein
MTHKHETARYALQNPISLHVVWNKEILPMRHGFAEKLPNVHILQREKAGHGFNGFSFVSYDLMFMNFNVNLIMTACG